MTTVENTALSTRVTIQEKERIMQAINRGEYMNMADFVRQAIREKLKATEK